MTIKDFPTVEELAAAMAHLPKCVEPVRWCSCGKAISKKDADAGACYECGRPTAHEDEPSIDVRLQVLHDKDEHGAGWNLRTGDASYDQDHRGYWGAASVGADDTLDTLKATANEMIEQAIEDAAQCDDFENE